MTRRLVLFAVVVLLLVLLHLPQRRRRWELWGATNEEVEQRHLKPSVGGGTAFSVGTRGTISATLETS